MAQPTWSDVKAKLANFDRHGLVSLIADANDPRTWKLPYLAEDGAVDTGRLPGAIRAVISNYRGTKVQTIPEAAVPEVLVRLGRGAASIRKLPGQGGVPNTTYEQLAAILEQLGKLEEVLPR
jgi:hypothetical protein